jgi:hypothetical protein
MLIFNANFCMCLQDAISTVQYGWQHLVRARPGLTAFCRSERDVQMEAAAERPSLDDLSQHAVRGWERVVSFMLVAIAPSPNEW